MANRPSVRQRPDYLFYVGDRDHSNTALLVFCTPPLLLRLVQDNQDLTLLERKILGVTSSEVIKRPHILQILIAEDTDGLNMAAG